MEHRQRPRPHDLDIFETYRASILDAIVDAVGRDETETFSATFRMYHKDGSLVWIDGLGRLFARDDDGQPLRMFGTSHDIRQIQLPSVNAVDIALIINELATNAVRHAFAGLDGSKDSSSRSAARSRWSANRARA
jgi:hypothetical protein